MTKKEQKLLESWPAVQQKGGLRYTMKITLGCTLICVIIPIIWIMIVNRSFIGLDYFTGREFYSDLFGGFIIGLFLSYYSWFDNIEKYQKLKASNSEE